MWIFVSFFTNVLFFIFPAAKAPVQYVRSRRGTHLVLHEYNTYTPNEKVRDGRHSRDWKCSMYHKAKCRARLVTRHTSKGDVIHITSDNHTHKPMYTAEDLKLMQSLQTPMNEETEPLMERHRPAQSLQCLHPLHLQQFQQLQLQTLYPQSAAEPIFQPQFNKFFPRPL
ncbi:PREDICTED: uncharacterized protein LOC108365624 [Rhagoletis zephyria]|uniref:uncharacterized protein LOC108365624 n=1 Tax=Rhagoletis zephyria TaxID=28612 RepID=UPI0008118AE2|nr:PREDICTED: uncharacterized protein LOC108365624 [Rhagoletis zephyria]